MNRCKIQNIFLCSFYNEWKMTQCHCTIVEGPISSLQRHIANAVSSCSRSHPLHSLRGWHGPISDDHETRRSNKWQTIRVTEGKKRDETPQTGSRCVFWPPEPTCRLTLPTVAMICMEQSGASWAKATDEFGSRFS